MGFGFTGLWDSGLTFCADISYNVVFDLAIRFSYTLAGACANSDNKSEASN